MLAPNCGVVGGNVVTILESILLHNRQYVEGVSDLSKTRLPSKRLAVLTCMDARIDPGAALGLPLGQAHILRNAGARVTDDVIRSLAISQQLLGTEAVVVMAHTDCGLVGLKPGMLKPPLAEQAISLPFYTTQDLREDLIADMDQLRASGWLWPHTEIYGLIFDVVTGQVEAV
jgi:carbonic anhydrase